MSDTDTFSIPRDHLERASRAVAGLRAVVDLMTEHRDLHTVNPDDLATLLKLLVDEMEPVIM